MHEARSLRAQIHSGVLTEAEAAKRLSEISNGGLTVVGALDLLRQPAQQVADAYRQIRDEALAGLDRIQAEKARRYLNSKR